MNLYVYGHIKYKITAKTLNTWNKSVNMHESIYMTLSNQISFQFEKSCLFRQQGKASNDEKLWICYYAGSFITIISMVGRAQNHLFPLKGSWKSSQDSIAPRLIRLPISPTDSENICVQQRTIYIYVLNYKNATKFNSITNFNFVIDAREAHHFWTLTTYKRSNM